VFIQKREAYFDYTAALGGSCAVLSLAEPPSVSLPASLVRPHWYLEMALDVEWRKSFVGWTQSMIENRRSR
jgi:hypothetical protein